MGYTRHHAICVTSWDQALITEAHAEAERLFSPPLGLGYVGVGDRRRTAFITYLRSKAYEDGSNAIAYAEVQYKDGNNVARVTRAGDRDRRRARAKAEG